MNQYRPGGFNILPPVTKNIIIICSVLYLAKYLFEKKGIDLDLYLGLHYFQSQLFKPYQFVTYIFMHGGFTHLLFNMFALWMFGSVIENVWGPKKFLTYFIITGLGAALIQFVIFYYQVGPIMEQVRELMSNAHSYQEQDAIIRQKNEILNSPGFTVVGASGSLFGLLLAYGMMFPNTYIYLYFFIPMKAKYFVALYGALELFSGISNNPGDNVAHFAHLGGMLFGFILILIWNKGRLRH